MLNVFTYMAGMQLYIDGQPELGGKIVEWQIGKDSGYAPTTPQTLTQPGNNAVPNWASKGFPWGQIKPTGYHGAESFICDGPVPGWVVTSDYDDSRTNGNGNPYSHSAFDYAVLNQPEARPFVKSPMGGKVIFAKFYATDAYGNLVVVENNGVLLYLAHLNSFAVKEGDVIQAGDVVGGMGNTGPSTGPHVHVEYRHDNNLPLDPRYEHVPGQTGACTGIYKENAQAK